MKIFRYKLSLTILLVASLPVLLGVLAILQYRWLSEISRAERERMQTRLQSDVKRFAGDFNGEITKAYFVFQIEGERAENPQTIAERYDLWQKQTDFPELIGEIYKASRGDGGNLDLLRFNQNEKSFAPAEWTNDLKTFRDKIQTEPGAGEPPFVFGFNPVNAEAPGLLIPVVERNEHFVTGTREIEIESNAKNETVFLIVKFDSEIIKQKLLPELARRHFSDSSYVFSIVNRKSPEQKIFQTAENADFSQPDAATELFEITPEAANILVLNSAEPRVRVRRDEKTFFFERRIEKPRAEIVSPQSNSDNRKTQLKIIRKTENADRIISRREESNGNWLLSVKHADGSLDDFVNKTRLKNLGISFGILALLGASVVLLLVSTQRAKLAAQRQLDFVSSVTHEFRTPIAVICSAGDNLADGIVNNPSQIERYGKLIRGEGNRLSEMVEQILEFAGARSRRKKYDFQAVSLDSVIETVLADCQPLLAEKNFTVEKQIAADLPPVLADPNALKQSLQNLVNNAIKYSDGNRQIKIRALASGERVKISVADHGIGIDARERKRIFEPFYRGQRAVADQIHGNGLGLSLVKQIVAAHNGDITVESAPEKGSVFTISLPVAKEARAQSVGVPKQSLSLNVHSEKANES